MSLHFSTDMEAEHCTAKQGGRQDHLKEKKKIQRHTIFEKCWVLYIAVSELHAAMLSRHLNTAYLYLLLGG